MAIAPASVVMRTTRARLRGRRLPFDRLRCCDNAVLPSAMRARRNAGLGPLRYRPASRMTARHIGRKLLRVLEQNPSTYGPSPSPDHVARTEGVDQALPQKKLCCEPVICVARI